MARRVYAATGDRIDARLFVNDAWIGSAIKGTGKRNIRIQVQGSDAIDKVELLKNDRLLRRFFPEPAAEPPVPTVLLEVPPPADEPPVPTVEEEPDGQLVEPAGQSPPAELPPVPIVLLAVPPPAVEPPVPTVLDDCANPDTAVPARSAAASATCVTFIIVYFLHLS